MPEVAGKTITPGTTAQTAVAAGRYVTGDVVVAGDSSLKAENIAEGVSIFGVQGTHSGGGELVTVTFSRGRLSQTLYYTDGGDSIKSATNGNGTVSFIFIIPQRPHLFLIVMRTIWINSLKKGCSL